MSDQPSVNLVDVLRQRYEDTGDTLARKAADEIKCLEGELATWQAGSAHDESDATTFAVWRRYGLTDDWLARKLRNPVLHIGGLRVSVIVDPKMPPTELEMLSSTGQRVRLVNLAPPETPAAEPTPVPHEDCTHCLECRESGMASCSYCGKRFLAAVTQEALTDMKVAMGYQKPCPELEELEPPVTHSKSPETTAVRAALQSLVDAVAHMRVPQTMADAALQVGVTIGPALRRAQEVLAAPETTHNCGLPVIVERLERELAAKQADLDWIARMGVSIKEIPGTGGQRAVCDDLPRHETPAPRFSYSREWLERSLAIADDSTAGAGGGFDWSCFVCGQATGPDQVAVAHMVHAGVVCCKRCKAASERGADEPGDNKGATATAGRHPSGGFARSIRALASRNSGEHMTSQVNEYQVLAEIKAECRSKLYLDARRHGEAVALAQWILAKIATVTPHMPYCPECGGEST